MKDKSSKAGPGLNRRSALKGAGVLAGAAAITTLPGFAGYARAGSDQPIRLGFQVS